MYLEDLAAAAAITLFCAMVLVIGVILSNPEWLEAVQ